jgi:hypothetical protein
LHDVVGRALKPFEASSHDRIIVDGPTAMNVSSETLTTTALLASWLLGAVNAPPWMTGTKH